MTGANESALRGVLVRLEELSQLEPLASERCRYRGAFNVPAALCPECDARRVRLAERFAFRPPETRDDALAEDDDEIAPMEEERIRRVPRREWTPHNSD